MKTFRHFTMALAVLIMVGEVYRSIGDGRHIMFVLDDIFFFFAISILGVILAIRLPYKD